MADKPLGDDLSRSKWGNYAFHHYIDGFPWEKEAKKGSRESVVTTGGDTDVSVSGTVEVEVSGNATVDIRPPDPVIQKPIECHPREPTKLDLSGGSSFVPVQRSEKRAKTPVKEPAQPSLPIPEAPPKPVLVDSRPREPTKSSEAGGSSRQWFLRSINGRWHLVGYETARSRVINVDGVEIAATPLQATVYGRLEPVSGARLTEASVLLIQDALQRLGVGESALQPGDMVLDTRGRAVFTVTASGIQRL